MPQSSIDLIVVMNLKTALKRRRRSAYSIAAALGHPNNWLYQVLNQKSGLLIPSLRKIATELGVSPGSLVDAPQDIPDTNVHASPGAFITGRRLAETREKSGRTQSEMAAALGAPYNQHAISAVESGQANLPLDRAALAAQKLDVSLDYLAGLTDDPTPREAQHRRPRQDNPRGGGQPDGEDRKAGIPVQQEQTMTMTITPNIQRIRGRIAEIGIIQADLALHLGIHESLLSAHLRGRRPLPEGLEEHIHFTLDLIERAKRAGQEAESQVMSEAQTEWRRN